MGRAPKEAECEEEGIEECAAYVAAKHLFNEAGLEEQRVAWSLSDYILKYTTRRGSNNFPALRHNREKGPHRGKQKASVAAPRREGSFVRKLK